MSAEDPRDQAVQYEWVDVGVLDFDRESSLYFVMKVNSRGRVCDRIGSTILNGGLKPPTENGELAHDQKDFVERVQFPSMYWVPPIRLCFAAENPRNFARRIIDAFRQRQRTEALIR